MTSPAAVPVKSDVVPTAAGLAPVIPGMCFHDLRHTHKTWMIEDGIPEVAQAKRLGHRFPGVRGIYSHVSPAVEQRLADCLQKCWENTGNPEPDR